jgi:hypothetical protein
MGSGDLLASSTCIINRFRTSWIRLTVWDMMVTNYLDRVLSDFAARSTSWLGILLLWPLIPNTSYALGTRLATEISKTAAVDFRQPRAEGQRASPEPTVYQYANRAELNGNLPGLDTMAPDDGKKSIATVVADPAVASAVESKTVKVGMSPDEVKQSLGNPDKIVDLGAKQVFI